MATSAPPVSPQQGPDQTEPSRPFRWTRRHYHQLIDAGVLSEEDAVELIEGVIYQMAPMLGPHAAAVGLAQDVLTDVFGRDYQIRVQLPLALGDGSEPEPDVAVVRGARRDFVADHPASAELVVEVADTTLHTDRARKGSLYARFSIQDYWITNLNARVLEVNRDPASDPTAEYGFSYRTRIVVRHDESIAPLAAPDKPVRAADVLP